MLSAILIKSLIHCALAKKIKTRIAANARQIAEGGEYEAQMFNKAQQMIRSNTVQLTTTPPLLAMCLLYAVASTKAHSRHETFFNNFFERGKF